MRILTQLLLVAMICYVTELAAQPNFVINWPLAEGVDLSAGKFMEAKPDTMIGPDARAWQLSLEEPVVQGQGRVVLRWTLGSLRPGGYVNVERSAYEDGPYDVVAVLRQELLAGQFVDEQPMRGKNFYRLKWVLQGGQVMVSRQVSAGLSGDMTCRFYPNPVDNMLIIRSEQALDLKLADANGKLRVSLKLTPGLQTVDVSNLEKGMYVITLTQLETGRVLTEKLIKK